MAKKVEVITKYGIYQNQLGVDLYTKSGKFELSTNLTQKELKTLYDEGFTNIVYKIGG